jgi:NAD(P)-dependent dehydrogenase (short-subunit alcohol dehydrogenase family)
MGWLDGKRALVVGAGSGIGRAVLHAFAGEGARVAAMELDPAKCERLAAERSDGLVRHGDATVLEDARAAVGACVDQFGGLDVLANCVGIFDFYRGLADLEEEGRDLAERDRAERDRAERDRAGSDRAGRRRRPRGAVRDGLVAAGLELARAGGPDAVVLREATRMVGVVPNAAYRHFANRDELLAAVCAAALRELADRMAAGVARVRGKYGDPAAAARRMQAIGVAYLEFAREEPGLFATAFALPQQHTYYAEDDGTARERTPLGHLRARLDELVDAGVLTKRRREGIEYPIWCEVHGLAVLTVQGPLRDVPEPMRRRLEDLSSAFIEESLS